MTRRGAQRLPANAGEDRGQSNRPIGAALASLVVGIRDEREVLDDIFDDGERSHGVVAIGLVGDSGKFYAARVEVDAADRVITGLRKDGAVRPHRWCLHDAAKDTKAPCAACIIMSGKFQRWGIADPCVALRVPRCERDRPQHPFKEAMIVHGMDDQCARMLLQPGGLGVLVKTDYLHQPAAHLPNRRCRSQKFGLGFVQAARQVRPGVSDDMVVRLRMHIHRSNSNLALRSTRSITGASRSTGLVIGASWSSKSEIPALSSKAATRSGRPASATAFKSVR